MQPPTALAPAPQPTVQQQQQPQQAQPPQQQQQKQPLPQSPQQFNSQQPNAQVPSQINSQPDIPGLITGWDGQQDTSTAEQVAAKALRAHLMHHSPKTGGQPVPVSHDDNMNIDPAISGVVNIPGQPVQAVVNLAPQAPPLVEAQHSMTAASPPEISSSPTDSGSTESPRRGGKRELSTSKRAAQNRAAQRAFRQRKETYIKKLEEQVRDMQNLEESYKQIQSENYQLRDYIINLQSRLIEAQGEDAVPPAPLLIAHPNPLIQSQPPPPALLGTAVIAPNPQPQPTAPTANMGVPAPVVHHQQAATQLPQGMVAISHTPVPIIQPQGVEGAKRSLEEDSSAAINGTVAKRLKAVEMDVDVVTTEQPKPAEVNGNSS